MQCTPHLWHFWGEKEIYQEVDRPQPFIYVGQESGFIMPMLLDSNYLGDASPGSELTQLWSGGRQELSSAFLVHVNLHLYTLEPMKGRVLTSRYFLIATVPSTKFPGTNLFNNYSCFPVCTLSKLLACSHTYPLPSELVNHPYIWHHSSSQDMGIMKSESWPQYHMNGWCLPTSW